MDISAFNKIGTISAAVDVVSDGTTGSVAAQGNVTVTFPLTTVADFRTAHTAADFVFVNYNVTQVIDTVSGIAIAYNNGTALLNTEATTATAGLLQLDNTIATNDSQEIGRAHV